MRNLILTGTFILITSFAHSQVYIDPGLGLVFKDNTGNPAPRFNMGIHNLLFNRIGVYGTLEVSRAPGAKLFSETDERDIFGGILRLNQVMSLYGGVGMLSNGLLSNGLSFSNVRKEAGVSFNIPSVRLNIDLGYSISNRLAVNIGYTIPGNKSVKKKKSDGTMQPAATKESVVKKQAPADQTKLKNPADTAVSGKPETDESSESAESLSDPIDLGKLKSSGTPPEPSQPAPDSENLTPGVYAINGVFRYRRNAQDEVRILKNAGFPKARIGFRASTGLYYVWLVYSNDEEEVRDFVLKNRANGKLSGVWMMRIK